MTTLAELPYLTDRKLSCRVFINGTQLVAYNPTGVGTTSLPGVLSVNITKSFETPVPICAIGVNRIPNWIERGQTANVLLGFNGLDIKVFTGTVQSRGRQGPGKVSTIECAGQLYPLFRSIEIPARDDVDGFTVSQVITSILDEVGITDRSLTIPAFTLGQFSDAQLERAPLSHMVQQLMDIDGLSIYETGSGTVVIRRIEATPAPSARFFYSTTDPDFAHIIDGSDQEDPSFTRTRVIVTGATVVEGTAPDETTRTIEATASVVGSSVVQPPVANGAFIDAEFSSPFVDSDAKAAEVAVRVLSDYNRVPRRLSLVVTGNPLVELGDTVEVTFPELGGTGPIANRFFVETIEHSVTDNYQTVLGLRGGDELGGSISVNPLADFTYSISRQIITDRVYLVLSLDGGLSHDPDGTIASYAWTDNQASTGISGTQSGQLLTVLADPSALSGSWIVSLAVTDNDGLVSNTVSKTIPTTDASAIVQVPSLFAALDVRESASFNGGENWNDQTESGCTVVAPAVMDGIQFGIACFGFSDGRIERTTDYCLSTPTSSGTLSGAIVDIVYDHRNFALVWALTATAKIYISVNAGSTFSLYQDIRNLTGLSTAIAGRLFIPPTGLGVYVFGGYDLGGGRVYAVYQAVAGSSPWVQISTAGGHLESDSPGPSTVNVASVAFQEGVGIVIGLKGHNGSGSLKGTYFSVNIFNSSNWRRATGTSLPTTDVAYVVPTSVPLRFVAAYKDRDIWKTSDGAAWTKTANVMPANVTPNHCSWLYNPGQDLSQAGVYAIAAEHSSLTAGLYLTADEFATVNVLRPATGFATWPTSAKGMWIAPGPTIGRTGRVCIAVTLDATAKAVLYRVNSPVWSKTTISSALSSCVLLIPRCVKTSVWFVVGLPTATDYLNSKAVRTTNAGTSFSSHSAPSSGKWQDFARDAGGRLWGLTLTSGGQVRIYYSEDDGANWTLAYNNTTATQQPCRIVCHPSNQDRIAILGAGSTAATTFVTIITADRGVSWTRNQAASVTSADQGHEIDALMLTNVGTGANNRIIVCGVKRNGTGDRSIMVSDDNGVSWSFKYNASTDRLLGPVGTVQGTFLYCLRIVSGDDYLVWSKDSGQTWASMAPVVPQPSGDNPKGGLAFDPVENAIYVLAESGQASNEKLIERYAPANSENQVWNDFSAQAQPIGATTFFTVADYAQQIAIIPR